MRRVCLLTGAAGKLGTAFIQKYGDIFHIAAIYNRSLITAPNQDLRLIDPLQPDSSSALNQKAVYAIQADLRSDEDLRRAVEVTLARFGQIDLVINSAADIKFHGSLLDITDLEDRFLNQLKFNAISPIRLVALVAKKFWQNQNEENVRFNRNVVNISSLSGLRIFPNVGQAFYSASKAALNYLTCHLAAELRPYRVRANALAPTAFPSRISAEQVIDSIHKIDAGQINGKVIALEPQGERLTN